MADLLVLDDLHVTFHSDTGPVEAVRGLSLAVQRGERVGIVGESGSGKSMTGRAILGLIRPPGEVRAHRLAFDGQDLSHLPERRFRRLRGRRIAMILQDPKYSLNPVMRVGRQIVEAFRTADPALSRRAARDRALAALAAVQIPEADLGRVYDAWPHELSGGMGQRVMIAMMVALGPDLLIADEPTSALDVTVQMQVLAILDDLVRASGMGLMFISHDLNLVAGFCDRVVVMYAGRVMEECRAADLHAARHPYTRGLLAALPSIEGDRGDLPVLQRDPAWREAPP
ncbi:ABC transporter ATP-binding protein [Roseospira marina]|uniref:ABC transporter ATP-binding protein n=1 Tax=Roseospira marina TaxID=140057 RepID=UPI0017C985F6|nr:ABC transporter ATP-binding protein [Roseospira marina]MBB4313772.1 peptide/nickel transport system ATP-binding protein [Roseospira marina]MBB5086934.1 peptide/nickel transport system ATP-binding protein [Roseospira marina]